MELALYNGTKENFTIATKSRLIREPRLNTPFVDFNGYTGELTIKGDSTRLEIFEFYVPVLKMVDEYLLLEEHFVCNLCFRRFNTSTAKLLFDLFKHFNKLSARGKKIHVNWLVDSSVSEMYEIGMDYKELFDLNFNIVKLW